MIQRVVRNGRVRAFGAEWELSRRALLNTFEGDTVHIHGDAEILRLYGLSEGGCGLVCIGHATRRPVVDLMANLRESLSGSER